MLRTAQFCLIFKILRVMESSSAHGRRSDARCTVTADGIDLFDGPASSHTGMLQEQHKSKKVDVQTNNFAQPTLNVRGRRLILGTC